MRFNLILFVLAISLLVTASIADHFGDHDDDGDGEVDDLISYLSGGDEELEHNVDEIEHEADVVESDDQGEMEDGLHDTAADLSDGHELLFRDIDRIDVLGHGAGHEDNGGLHFEALSAVYDRKEKNMYKKKKPAQKGYSKEGQRSAPDADMMSEFPTTAPAGTIKPPSFDDFNNAKPQNDGNCLHAVNRERQAAGVPELAHNQTLVDLAARHTAYMAASQALSHDGFWSYRFDAVPAGVIGVGELVVADLVANTPNGPAKRAVDRWVGSVEHKALLLRPDMFIMGCSTAQGNDGRFYATAIICSK